MTISLVAKHLLAAVVILATSIPAPSLAVTPESPAVKALIKAGLASLESIDRDPRLGAGCLSALAFMKADQAGHPRVAEAISNCVRVVSDTEEFEKLDCYSFGLAMILLCEDRTNDHDEIVRRYMAELERRQKAHGGWGYDYSKDGDTSQTQYLALALWAAHVQGRAVAPATVSGLMEWLVNTQDPTGGWGYQGRVGSPDNRVKQSKVTCTLGAAALSSLMIGADLCGKLQEGAQVNRYVGEVRLDELPAGVSLARDPQRGTAQIVEGSGGRKVRGVGVSWKDTFEAMRIGDQWMSANFELPAKNYPNYYLYALERYESFREYRDGQPDPEPRWYTQGFEYLSKAQLKPGYWNNGCKAEADTAFAVLFLLRSTQKSIRFSIGEGTLVSGRGLPKRLSGARLRGGRVIADLDATDIGGFLAMIDSDDADRLDALAEEPDAIDLSALTDQDVRRLKQLLRGASPDARFIAATALGRLSRLDDAPALIYAMTDPERRVAIAARDGLRAISRRSRGFGLADNFTEDQRFATIERWKRWYAGIRPDALFE